MTLSSSGIALAAVSLACYAGFAWAVRQIFRPSAVTRKMTAIKFLGTAFAIAQIVLLSSGHVASGPYQVVGLAMYAASLALFWWAASVVRRRDFAIAFTATSPRELVTTGPYKWLRHPLYTSYSLYWLAGLLATGVPWMLGSVLVMTTFYALAIRQEEREFLGSALADAYVRYRARAGVFFPKF